MTGRLHRLCAVLALAPLLLVAACGGTVAPPGPGIGTQMDATLPAAIRNLPLVDSTGHVRLLSDFVGKVVVISDSMTLCQESCPMDTASLVQAARAVDAAGYGKDATFLTITVDPRRDVPAQLAAYRALYHGPSNWLALTGTPAHIRALWKYLGVYVHRVPSSGVRNWRTGQPLTYDIQHSDETFFLDTRGRERFLLDGMPHVSRASEVPERLRGYLSRTGHENLAHAGDWTVGQALTVTSWLLGHHVG